jgi:hypothetical protein
MFAFVAVGFAHDIHHLETSEPAAASQVSIDQTGTAPDSPYKASLIVEHCLGCTIVAVVPSSDCSLAVACRASIAVADPDAVRSHDLALELPPPKSLT